MSNGYRIRFGTTAVLMVMVLSVLAAVACSNSNDETVQLLEDPKIGLSHLNDEFHTIKGEEFLTSPTFGLAHLNGMSADRRVPSAHSTRSKRHWRTRSSAWPILTTSSTPSSRRLPSSPSSWRRCRRGRSRQVKNRSWNPEVQDEGPGLGYCRSVDRDRFRCATGGQHGSRGGRRP